ncbi:MAG: hypothetical protein DRP59_02465 [Spirochaetes bacterium]|nr:MAG: hypothetical protein DRP59_02465 [Spirochaetota bacterium]
MKISQSIKNFCSKTLSEGMDVHTMFHIVRRIIPDYDIYKQTGFPESFAIPNRDAADAIVRIIIERNMFLQFIELLITLREEGLMSKKINLPYLNEMIREIYNQGYIYDPANRIFVENPRIRKTLNWGTLREGDSYTLVFLGIDIINNTGIVKKYPKNMVEQTYTEFSFIVQNICEKRNGRLWNWEGDGGVVAFFLGKKYQDAVLSSMEILNDMFLYNRTICSLKEHLNFRISIHSGNLEYTENRNKLIQEEPLKVLQEMEKKYSAKNTICISLPVKMMLDGFIADQFSEFKKPANSKYFHYKLQWEQ